jgi:hypothetical protein
MTYESRKIISISGYDRLYYYPTLLREEIETAFTNGHELNIYYLLLDDTHFAYFPNSKSGCVFVSQYMTNLQWYYDVYALDHLHMKWNEIDNSLF